MCGHFFIAISLEILVILAILLFIARVKKEELGKGFKWIGYILLIIGFLTLAGTIMHSVMSMGCCRQHCEMGGAGMCGPGMGHCCNGMNEGCKGDGMMHDGGMMKDGKACCDGAKDGKMGGKCPYDKDGKEKGQMDSTKLK